MLSQTHINHKSNPINLFYNNMSSFKDLLGDLNKKHRAEMLMLAWHHFNLAHATDVQLTSLNDQSYGIKVFLKRKETKDVVYHFTDKEMKKGSDGVSRLPVSLKQYHNANVPPLAVQITLFLLVLFIGALPAAKLFFPLTFFKPYIAQVLSEGVASMLLKVVVFLHALEALYIQYLIAPVVTSPAAKAAWFVPSLILGYPVTQRAMLVSKLYKDSKK